MPPRWDGFCPSPSYISSNKYCCCAAKCCWDRCILDQPPDDCLQAVPNAKWVLNCELGYYQAQIGNYFE